MQNNAPAESIQMTGRSFPGTATQQAPQAASLDQTEPTSTIGSRFIAENVPETSNYDDIIRLTPSAMDVDPNGPGLQQDFGQSIRGLQYHNYIASTVIGTNTLYSNQGNATFEGVELDATAQVGRGFALYANGSLNHATYHDGASVAQAPRRTAVAGVLFDREGMALTGDRLDASLLIKDVGPQYGLDTGFVNRFPIKSYDTTDAALHYLLPLRHGRRLDLGVQVTNLFNNASLIGYAGAAAGNGAALYWVNPDRGVFFNVSSRL